MKRPPLPPPLQGLLAALSMWGVARFGPPIAVAFPGQGAIAIAIASVGLAIDLISVAAFLRAKTTVNPMAPERAEHLVVDGLYRISRNPMYLGLLLILIGWGVWLGNPLSLLIIPAWMFVITEIQIKPEERALSQVFGDDYDAYRRRVRRWI
ncbi:MAG: isoprenylcysteine carboxylmethyltransferase family protein [Pseudomonadota bacterium]